MLFHTINATLQESIFRLPKFRYVLHLTLLNQLSTGLLGLGAWAVATRGQLRLHAPLRHYAILAVALALTASLTNYASSILSYPVQVVFKSAKLLFVMASGRVLFGKHYSWGEFGGCAVVVGGVVWFTLAGVSAAKSSGVVALTPWQMVMGVGCVLTSMAADVAVNLVEEHVLFHTHRCSTNEVLAVGYLLSSPLVLGAMSATGQLSHLDDFAAVAGTIVARVLLAAALSFLATSAVVLLVRDHGSVYAVLTTSVRKIVTVVLSYLLFPKPGGLTTQHGAALWAVGMGLLWHEMAKRGGSKRLHAAVAADHHLHHAQQQQQQHQRLSPPSPSTVGGGAKDKKAVE